MMGILLLFNGAFMLFSALISWYFKDGAFHGILYAVIITMLFGSLLQFSTMGFKKQIKKREGYLVVTLGWVLCPYPVLYPIFLQDQFLPLPMHFLKPCRVTQPLVPQS